MPRAPRWWTPRQHVELILDDEEDGSGSVLHEVSAIGDPADVRTFIPLSSGSWERRLTRREKTIRGGISAVVVAAIALALLGGPGSVLAYLGGVAQTLNPAPVAEAAAPTPSNALDVPIPANIAENPLISLTPVNGPNALAYACWVDETTGLIGHTVAAPLHLAEYAVTSHNWTPLTPPVEQAAGCSVVTDMTGPDSVVLVLAHAVAVGSPCQLPDLYHSEDSGAHWAALPWPTQALTPCALVFDMESGRFYVQSDTRLLAAENTAASAGQIAVTADGGATWAAADEGLAGLSQVSLVALRPDGRLLAQGIDPQRRGDTTLWQSDDAGAHWRFVLSVPGVDPHVYASSDPDATGNGGWGRLYIYSSAASGPSLRGLTGASGDAASGASLLTGFVEPQWTLSSLQPNGAALPRWSSVALPLGIATPDTRPAGMWLREASEGPVGSMIFTQPHAASLFAAITLPIDLLFWNGTAWNANAQVIPANANLQGATWDHGVMRIWVTHKAGILRPVQLLTFTVSPADAG